MAGMVQADLSARCVMFNMFIMFTIIWPVRIDSRITSSHHGIRVPFLGGLHTVLYIVQNHSEHSEHVEQLNNINGLLCSLCLFTIVLFIIIKTGYHHHPC